MPDYQVKQGDCISSIAAETGFFWATLWELPENAALRTARENPNALLAGDTVFYPDKRLKELPGQTGMRHNFRLLGVPVRFQARIQTPSGHPRASVPYTLTVDGQSFQGTTGLDGEISEIIPANAISAALTLSPPGSQQEKYTFKLGYMNPATDIKGIQARLRNMGYYKEEASGTLDDATKQAIRDFQRDAGLTVTGEMDADTQAELTSRHGG